MCKLHVITNEVGRGKVILSTPHGSLRGITACRRRAVSSLSVGRNLFFSDLFVLAYAPAERSWLEGGRKDKPKGERTYLKRGARLAYPVLQQACECLAAGGAKCRTVRANILQRSLREGLCRLCFGKGKQQFQCKDTKSGAVLQVFACFFQVSQNQMTIP